MIKDIITIAQKASQEIINIYHSLDFEIEIKNDHSPVTKADKISHEIICKGLQKISSYPILSEEDYIDYSIRKTWNLFWLIDPLDGTKDFIHKNNEFTINIALIHNQKPVLGLIYIPCKNDFYYAEANKGSYKNHHKIFNFATRNRLIAADSNFHSTDAIQSFFKTHHIQTIKKIGSSIKFCELAEGTIDVYPRLNGTKEWDTAAAHIIAKEAGCKLIDIETKKELIYNKPNIKNNHFIASRNNLSFV